MNVTDLSTIASVQLIELEGAPIAYDIAGLPKIGPGSLIVRVDVTQGSTSFNYELN